MLMPYYSIGSEAGKIEKYLTAEFLQNFRPVFVVHPGMKVPVILPENPGKIDTACWGIAGRAGHHLPWLEAAGTVKNKYRMLIRKQRCLIPANGFFVQYAGKHYFIYFPEDPVFTLGGLFTCLHDNHDRATGFTFSTLIRESPPAFRKISPVLPVIISKSSRRRYLNHSKPLMDITHMLQKEIKLNFNGIEISPVIFSKKNPEASDFSRTAFRLFPTHKFPEKEIMGTYFFYQ